MELKEIAVDLTGFAVENYEKHGARIQIYFFPSAGFEIVFYEDLDKGGERFAYTFYKLEGVGETGLGCFRNGVPKALNPSGAVTDIKGKILDFVNREKEVK